MPNRILRDWTDSERVNELSVHAERFFIRLIMKVDDFGRFSANTKLLKSNLFPLLTDSILETDIIRWMAECQKSELIAVYEVSSKPYLEIQNFNQRLRLKKEKYPSNKNDRHAPATCKTEDGLNRSRNEVEVETEVEVEGNRTHEEYSPIKKSDLKPYEKQTTEKKVAEFKLWTIESELWVEQSCMALRTDKEKLIAFCTDWINKAVIQKKFESYQNRNLISFMVKDFTPEKSSSSGEKQSKFSQAIESHKEAEKLLGIHKNLWNL